MKKKLAFLVILLTMASSRIVFADSGVVNASSLKLRQKPSLSSRVISSLPRNTKINTLGKAGSFYKISYKGKTGYVYKSYIKIVPVKITPPPVVKVKAPVAISRGATVEKYDALVSSSIKFLGMPYKYGGTTPAKYNSTKKYIGGGFDCSGFTQYIYKSFNISLPRVTTDQMRKGTAVSINNLKKGDLVFFIGGSHTGMYIGDNKFIHSHKTGSFVKITELTGFWRGAFVTGRRILK